jgi:hypothetical protein
MERRQPRHCIENSTTPSYFSIHFACFFKTNKTLEVTLKQNFVSSSDEEATAEALYRELDKPRLTSRYNFLSKITRSDIDKTLCQFEPAFQGTQAGDGEATAMALYRELDNAVLLLDTIFYRKSLEVTGRELDKSNSLIFKLLSRKIREFFKLPIN